MKSEAFLRDPYHALHDMRMSQITPACSQTSFTVGGKVTDGMNRLPFAWRQHRRKGYRPRCDYRF